MTKIRVTQPTFGLDFEFEPVGNDITEKDIYDIIKQENLLPGQQMLKTWQKPNTKEEDKEFVRQAFKAGYFEEQSDNDFTDAFVDGLKSFGRGFANISEQNQVNDRYDELLLGIDQAKYADRDSDFSIGSAFSNVNPTIQYERQNDKFAFGNLSKKNRQRIDKTALDFYKFFYKSNSDSKDNDPERFKKFAKGLMQKNNLNYQDESLVNEIIRRGGEIGRAQANADFYQGISEWSGGYSMLSNFVTKHARKSFGQAKKLRLTEYGYQQGEVDEKQEIDIELDYLAKNAKLARGMEDGAEDVAIALDQKTTELALRNELVKPNPDTAMVYSFVPDLPMEFVTGGVGALTQAGVSGLRRIATKGQIEMLQSELQKVGTNIGKLNETIDFNKANNQLGVLSETQDPKKVLEIRKRQNKKIDILEKNLAKQKAEQTKLVNRVNNLTGNITQPGFLQQGAGLGATGLGVTADLLGRTLEVVRRLPKEVGIDLIMKAGAKTPEQAEQFFNNLLKVGTATGALVVGSQMNDDQFFQDLQSFWPALIPLIGPEVLQTMGTSLRHLGSHWSAHSGSKNVFEHVQQLNSKNPKFSNIIIDRTDGADIMGKTLPTVGNIFKRGETGNFMGKQGITRAERFVARSLVDTNVDKALSFAGRAGLSATTASTLPTAFGYAMGGVEGAGMALGASAPFIGLGIGVGEVARYNNKALAQIKTRGDIENHRKNLSSEQSFLFNRLSQANQAGLASAQIAFPDAKIELIQGSKEAGSHSIQNGQSIIKINVDSNLPLLPVLAHEVGHHIKAHGLTPMIHDIMFGDPLKNKGGLFSRYDIEKNEFVVEEVDGVKRFATNDQFNELRDKYIKALEDQPGGVDELTRREYNTREAIADEVFAEYVAQHILSNKSRDLQSGMMRSLFGAMSGKPFLRKAGHNLGLFSRSEDNLMFQVLPDSPELNNLITEFQKKSGRLSPEELAESDGVVSRNDENENDIIITPDEQIKNPKLLDQFNTSGIFKTDADGNIEYGIGGRPKLMTKAQVDKQQGQMANDLLQAIENAGDNLPTGHVVMNDNNTASGMFLSESIIDNLKGYNASQINFLRMVSDVGRRMATQGRGMDPGNQAIMFYFSAMKHGGKYYRSLRGGYRNMLIYGMEVSKDGNIYFRTISLDKIDENINFFLKREENTKQLLDTFGGNSIGELRQIINNKFDVYYSNQAKGIENGTKGSGITEGEKNYLNAFLGDTGSGNVDANPILSALGKKKAESMSAIRSRRLDRIGTINFPGGGQPVRIRKIINNLMPGRKKDPNQLEMDFSENVMVADEPPVTLNWYKLNGVDPDDPNKLPKIADRLISPGNRNLDGDIARDMHENFGYTFREMLDALGKAHNRDEYRNNRFRRYMPNNLGLKDNVVDGVLPGINQEKFSGEQFNSAIGKVAGAKAYADDIGLTSFLEGKKSVTKTDIEDFVAENHLKLDSYDLADPVEILNIDDLLARFQTDEELYTAYPNLRYHKEGFSGMLASLESIDDLKRAKKDGYTQARTNYGDRTKYNRSTLVTPGERTNYNETLVEFEGGGRFEVPESSTLQYEGVIEFADPDLIDDFLTDMSIGGHEELNYGREYKEDLMDAVEVVTFKGNAEEYKIIKEVAENYKFDGVTITPGESRVPLPGGAPTFKNTHWDSDKVIGHIRRTDRTIDGKDTRFLEEMQSDWLQALRKGNAPDAPFAKNWPALLLKKAMMDAINDGKTHIAWADGKVHNDRYSLTRTLDSITMEPGVTPGIRELYLNTKEQGEIQLQVDGKGRVLNSDHEGFVGKGLDEVIGKQMADKILEEPSWDDALRRKKLNALDQEIDKYKEFAKEFESGRFNHSNDFINIGNATDLSSALRKVFDDYSDKGGPTLRTPDGREFFVDHIQDKIRDLQKQSDQAYDGIVKYEGKDLDLSDPALPNFYDKEVVKVASKLAKKLGVGKPEKVKVPYNPFPNIEHIPDGAWMMELPTREKLQEQTLYMPGQEGQGIPENPGLPLVHANRKMSLRNTYKVATDQEISEQISIAKDRLNELGGTGEMGDPSFLIERERRMVEQELNNLLEVEADNINTRNMPGIQTNTQAFKNWFKDSKVVDEDGEPLVVYHGTPYGKFNTFIDGNRGMWFATNKDYSKIFRDKELNRYLEELDEGMTLDDIGFTQEEFNQMKNERKIFETYLSIQNPFDMSSIDMSKEISPSRFEKETGLKLDYINDNEGPAYGIFEANYKKIVQQLKDKGYDGIKSFESVESGVFGSDKPGASTETYVPFEPEQIKSATGNRGTFDPGNPDIRFMPYLDLPGDKSVQYKKTKNVTNIMFDDATRLAGKKFTILEADRQDTDGGNMGGPLFPFLKSNDIVVTEGGNDYRLMWANLTSKMIEGTMDRVGMTDDGHAFIQIMQEEAHRSNKVMFGNILNSFEANKKNMSPLEIEVLANVIYFLRERKVNPKTWNPSAEQKSFFTDDIKNYKSSLSRGDTAKANQILVDAKAKYGQTDWWNSKEVKSYMADFNNAFTHKSFNARADISNYFIPKPKVDGTLGAKLPFVPDLKKLLKSNADYHGAKTGDAVGVVQLSKHKLDTFEGKTRVKNEDRVFAIYTGKDPGEIAFMSKAEKRILKKLQANPKFKAHKAYDWIMLGPAKGDRFLLNRPLNIVKMMDKSAYTKNHRSVWKNTLLKMQGDAVRRYGSTTMRTGLDLKNKKDKKEHDFFVKLDKFSKKKPLDKQPESNIIGAILRGKEAGSPVLSKFMQDLK